MLRKLTGRFVATTKSTRLRIRCFSANIPPPPPLPSNQISERMAPLRSYSPEHGFVWSSAFGHITVPDQTVDEYVWQNVNQWPDKTAIECGITGRKYSYGKLRDHCAAVAYRLRNEFNLQSGDVVAISMPNVPEYAIAVLGSLEAGLKLTTINPVYTAGIILEYLLAFFFRRSRIYKFQFQYYYSEEQARQLAMTDAKLVFSVSENVETILNACSINKTKLPVVALKVDQRHSTPSGIIDFAELMKTTGTNIVVYNLVI